MVPYIQHEWPLGKVQHYVYESDYDNWAIIYGCKQFFGFFVSYATLLSRKPSLDYRYVKQAQFKLDEINYDHEKLWVETGGFCGFDAQTTPIKEIMNVLSNEPDWDVYNPKSDQTKRFKQMYTGWFTGKATKLPSGTLDSNLGWSGSFFSV